MKMKKKHCILIIAIWGLFLFGCAGGGFRGKEGTCSVTVSIRCDTAVANGMNQQNKWKGIIPDNGCILPETVVEVPQNSTVFDVLCLVRDEYGIQMEYSGGKKTAYIEGIGNLYERDGGRWSGWMFSVNQQYPSVGCGEYTLEDGDYLRWDYTCDLGSDIKADTEESEKWKKENE